MALAGRYRQSGGVDDVHAGARGCFLGRQAGYLDFPLNSGYFLDGYFPPNVLLYCEHFFQEHSNCIQNTNCVQNNNCIHIFKLRTHGVGITSGRSPMALGEESRRPFH